jgi:hypothetical protein
VGWLACEPVDEPGRARGGLEELADARRREARDRVQLVQEHLAVLADEEVDPRHPLALARDERAHREFLHALDRLRLEARRHDELHAALVVLGREVVPIGPAEPVRDDLSRKRGDWPVVAEHAAFDLDPVDELLDEHLVVVLEGELDGGCELLVGVGLGDADRGSEPGRFDEDRIPERVLGALPRAKGDVASDRDASVAHHRLEHVLVHGERRAEDACTDVRHSRELEKALHRSVLPEGPVQDREDDVDVPEGRRHLRCRHRQRLGDGAVVAAAELPATVAPDLDRDRVVALGVEGVQDRAGRGHRDLVLGGAAAHEDGDADALLHTAVLVNSVGGRVEGVRGEPGGSSTSDPRRSRGDPGRRRGLAGETRFPPRQGANGELRPPMRTATRTRPLTGSPAAAQAA